MPIVGFAVYRGDSSVSVWSKFSETTLKKSPHLVSYTMLTKKEIKLAWLTALRLKYSQRNVCFSLFTLFGGNSQNCTVDFLQKRDEH